MNDLLKICDYSLDRGDTDAALASCHEAVRLSPDNPDSLITLGRTFRKRGQYAEAISAYEKALAMTPNAPGILTNLGNIYNDQHLDDKAIEYYRKALVQNPNLAFTHEGLGLALEH